MQERERKRQADAAAAFLEKSMDLAERETLFSTAIQALVAGAVILAAVFGGIRLIEGRLLLGNLLAFIQYVGMMSWPLTGLSWAVLYYRKGNISLRRMLEVLETPQETPDEGLGLAPLKGEIEVRHLTFRHPGSRGLSLDDVSFTARPGERIAIVGPIGSGKSTLLSLIVRLMDPPPGTVFVDGQDVCSLKRGDLRRRIVLLTQDSFLFSGTVRENILMGALDGKFRKEAIESAAKVAQVVGNEFPGGLESLAGERGTTLSGGQRQRVAFARALVRESEIMLLDDGLSALDTETEAVLWKEFKEYFGPRTLLMVTHRPRRCLEADRVLVLEGGRLREDGPPGAVLRQNGTLARLMGRQDLSHRFQGSQ
jgi:ATP-binding cassette subfamily B protein